VRLDGFAFARRVATQSGRVLAQTGEPSAPERSAVLLGEALGEYRELGMEPWERKAERALEETGFEPINFARSRPYRGFTGMG
jgi:hypothetical protein